MKMDFEVVYADGRKVACSAKPKDFVAFERQYGKTFSAFANDPAMEWVYYLAWAALHRMRQEPADFDGFLDVVDDVTPVNDEETPAAAADPSSPAPSLEPSSPSQ